MEENWNRSVYSYLLAYSGACRNLNVLAMGRFGGTVTM